jgi:hypothetical protein
MKMAFACAAVLVVACGGEQEDGTTILPATSASTGGGGSGASGPGGGGPGGSGGAPASRRVFVSSITYPGDLGGVVGGDVKCQAHADAANLGGSWLAWLSDTMGTPSTRFEQSAVPYVLVGGEEVAADWADLTDGTLTAPIDQDEDGTQLPVADMAFVWTGTNADGAQTGGSCSEWTDTISGGWYGSPTATDAAWSFLGGGPCQDESRHLYCFEQ